MKFTEQEARQSFLELLRIPSVTGTAGEEQACAYLEGILDRFGIAHRRICRDPKRPNLLAKLTAVNPTEDPMILISHIDVVSGDPEKWTHGLFSADCEGGRIWARGTLDTKHLTVMELYAFLHLAGQEAALNRDVYFLATIDEEQGSAYGMGFVRQAEPELFQRGMVINEGGGFPLRINSKNYMMLTVGEKAVCKVRLTATGTGVHASAPGADQAMLKMAKALKNIFSREEELQCGSHRTQDTQAAIVGSREWDNPVGADIFGYAGQNSISMRSFLLGERSNVIPAQVETLLEFKVLPYSPPEEITAFLDRVLEDCQVSYAVESYEDGFESSFDNSRLQELISQIQRSCTRFGFDGGVLPMLALGRTDGRFFAGGKAMVYGLSPLTMGDSFDVILPKVHGNDESILEDSFRFGCRVLDEIICNNCGCPGAIASVDNGEVLS